jgi:phage tail-like protein
MATPLNNRANIAGRLKNPGDYNLSTKFSVEIAGNVVGSIISVDGLEHSHETVEYKDPEDMTTRYRPGNNKTTRIKITREWSNDTTFIDWYQNVVKGQTKRTTITVNVLSDDGNITMSLNFYNAYPETYTFPSFKSMGSAHAVESLTCVFENFDYKRS